MHEAKVVAVRFVDRQSREPRRVGPVVVVPHALAAGAVAECAERKKQPLIVRPPEATTPQFRAGLITFKGARSMNVMKLLLVIPSKLYGSRK
jgi:hypothetical protein